MKKHITSLLLIIFFLFPTKTFAAELFFDISNQPSVNQPFELQVLVNSPDEYINAYEGTIEFDGDVQLNDVSDANSIVSLWVESPDVNQKQIRFSGITPGGFEGNNGLLFTIKASALTQNDINARFEDVRILLHDGEGTPAELSTETITISTTQTGEVTQPSKDTIPPELFTPVISRDENAFDNQWFVAFNTQDKQSGISHYEVKEALVPFDWFGTWVTAQSPHVLQDQARTYYVSVKAIDKAGNERVVTLPPDYPNIYLMCIVILALSIGLLLGYRFVRHNINRKKQIEKMK